MFTEKIEIISNEKKRIKYVIEDILDKAGIDFEWEDNLCLLVKLEDLYLVKDILEEYDIEIEV